MLFKKITTRFAKKTFAVMMTAATAFSCLSLSPNSKIQTVNAASNLPDGIYYIKNANSNLYMDLYGNNNGDGTKINQYSFHGARCQRFRVTYHNNDGGYYSIHALNNPRYDMALDLEDKDASMRNGTRLQIWLAQPEKVAEQRFTITSKATGYEIGTWASGGQKVLEVENSSKNRNAFIDIKDRNDSSWNDNWFFEPANMKITYNTTCTLSTDDERECEQIQSNLWTLGYSRERCRNCSIASLKEDVKDSSVIIMHGHGSSNSTMPLPSGETLTPSTARSLFNEKHQQLVYYAVCYSGANTDKNNGFKSQTSLVDATYANGTGANCVIGYRNTVKGAERFLLNMLEYTKAHKYATIEAALKYAKDQEWARFKAKGGGSVLPMDNPASPNNLVVVGNTNAILDLRYPG